YEVRLCLFHIWFISYNCDLRPVHAFPTRRTSDLGHPVGAQPAGRGRRGGGAGRPAGLAGGDHQDSAQSPAQQGGNQRAERRAALDRKSTRLNSSHVKISYAVFCLKKKKTK